MERSKKIALLKKLKGGQLSVPELLHEMNETNQDLSTKPGVVIIYRNRDTGPFYQESKPEKLYTKDELNTFLKDYRAVCYLPEKKLVDRASE